jgi:hypothetical protein
MSEENKPVENPPAEKPVKKIELTEEELNARLESAKTAEREEAKRQRDAEKQEAERETAKNQGEFQKLYEGEQTTNKKLQAERDALALDLRREKVYARLRDHLAATTPEYLSAAKYMQPLLNVTPELSDAEADKQIKAVSEQYVKDNPRSAKMGAAPPSPAGNRVPAGAKTAPRIQSRSNGSVASGF